MVDPLFFNQDYLEERYQEYLQDPSSIPKDLAYFFKGIEFANLHRGSENVGFDPITLKAYRLVEHFKRCGHYKASTNPLVEKNIIPLELSLMDHGLSEKDLEKTVPTFDVMQEPSCTLRKLIEVLKQRYEGSIGFEYMHMIDAPLILESIDRYLVEKFDTPFSADEIKKIYEDLKRAEAFEAFIHKRHMGKKRFSLEGAESLIPMLEYLIEVAPDYDLTDIVIGMAHRGRLNVLAHVLQKEISQILYEFESDYTPKFKGSGDVKYHMGYKKVRKGVNVTLAANPSHLESVDPVILGMCRAKQDLHQKNCAIPITIHGDAALAGQGVVYETLQAMRLDGYKVGGGIHIVINNQVGFTARPEESRSTVYCTDIAKTFNCPVFHVNAMDPLSCVRTMRLAIFLAREYELDVFIDLLGYRKYGHNEGDEPAYTHPKMVETIKKLPSVSSLVDVPVDHKVQFEEMLQDHLEACYLEAKSFLQKKHSNVSKGLDPIEKVESRIELDRAKQLLVQATKIPSDFQVHSRLKKIYEDRMQREVMDWAVAESIAFASLLTEGKIVRLSGEDSRRGTFSHRHAALIDQKSENVFIPLNEISVNQAPFYVINSFLSEYAVMGYEFGYTLMNPEALVIWEGQFGDFVNGAQIVIDQYISSCETKWGIHSGLVLYLPHGYEGQGPEHSSARIERFLELGAEENYRCVIPTSTGQLFHLLREQGLMEKKKPLILFTPKSLLRDEISFSPMSQVEKGFETIRFKEKKGAKKMLITFGKIFYDIIRKMTELKNGDFHLLAVEQLYPFDEKKFKEIFDLTNVDEIIFVQDEPVNMGAYPHLRPRIEGLIAPKKLRYVGRAASSSPAAGSPKASIDQWNQMMEEIFHAK